MASRFWVGWTWTWDASDTSHWSATSGGGSGASVPGSGDNATFNGSSGGGTVTVNTNFSIVNFSLNGFTWTVDFSVNNNSPTMSTFGGGSAATIVLWSGTHTITGTWGFAWSTNSTTITAGTSTIKFTDTSNTALSFLGSGRTFNNLWFSRWASTATNTISGANTYNDFKDDGTAAHSIIFPASTTQTFTTFTVSGSGAGNEITINSSTTAIHTLTAPSKSNASPISCDYLNIQHSVTTQTNTWYAGANSINNQATATAGSGWVFSAPVVISSSRKSLSLLWVG